MITYKNFAPTIAERAFKELAKRECFLSGETVIFALFSDYSELTNKKKKINGKSYEKYLVPRSDEFSLGMLVARAITIDQIMQLNFTIWFDRRAAVPTVKCEL